MLAIEITRLDGQVIFVKAGWQLWDWVNGGKARLWLVRANCGCADRGGSWEKCRSHADGQKHRLIQLASDGLPEDMNLETFTVCSNVLNK
jgi:hypothetical protein